MGRHNYLGNILILTPAERLWPYSRQRRLAAPTSPHMEAAPMLSAPKNCCNFRVSPSSRHVSNDADNLHDDTLLQKVSPASRDNNSRARGAGLASHVRRVIYSARGRQGYPSTLRPSAAFDALRHHGPDQDLAGSYWDCSTSMMCTRFLPLQAKSGARMARCGAHSPLQGLKTLLAVRCYTVICWVEWDCDRSHCFAPPTAAKAGPS